MKSSRNLARDDSGAILAMCVFMAAFLVGCLWYVMGIGDAAVHRERLQDGSDAAVYAAAVYHARGMNLIAITNLCMAANLAVLAALKTSQILNLIHLGIVIANCLCSPFGCPFDCPYIQPSEDLAQDLDSRISQMEPELDALLRRLSTAQDNIARVVPHQAAARAARVAQDYSSHVDQTVAASISMFPEGKRLGLPVQQDKYSKLCEKAQEVIWEVALNPLIAYGLKWQYVAGMVPAVSAEVTSSMCDDSTTNGKTPKKVFEDAKNGDKYFQVYGWALNTRQNLNRADKGVNIPAWGKGAMETGIAQGESKPFELERIGMADAEFYYDQVKPNPLDWDDYKDEAMWNMRWRARLRRYKRPPSQVEALAPGGLGFTIDQFFSEIIH